MISRRFSVAVITVAIGCLTSCKTSPAVKEANYLKKGQSLYAAKDYARALLEFRSAAQVMPKDAEPYYQIGLVNLAQANYAESVQFFKKALQLNPKHAQAQLNLANLMITSPDKQILQDAEGRLKGSCRQRVAPQKA
jgi:cytochrome c-type biogenesis protein CcmH/NrfG